MSPSPDAIFSTWAGVVDDNFAKTVQQTFAIPQHDAYVYRAESFARTLSQIQADAEMKYKYYSHGQEIEVSAADITAYTSIFSPSTDTAKALIAFKSNAKKDSPRETVANYLFDRRLCPYNAVKSRKHVNPYLDIWAHSCQLTAFLGPLPDSTYASPANAKRTHPILPVLYHHFGCAVPSWEALYIISQLAPNGEVIDMGSGNGYWTYMLRQMKLNSIAVDNMSSEYRTMWISDTLKTDGVEYMKKNNGGKGKLLLMVYMVTAGDFTKQVTRAYHGETIVVVGTQNANRYTGFSDRTTEEWFEAEMPSWELTCRIAMPSFAGKDEALFVWRKKT